MKLKSIIDKIKNGVATLYTQSPVELVVCVAFTIAAIAIQAFNIREESSLMYFPFYLAMAMVCNQVFAKKRQHYWLWSLLGACVLLYPTLTLKIWEYEMEYGVALAIAVLAVLLTRARNSDDDHTSASIITTLADAALGVITGVATFIIIMSFLSSINYLFDLDKDWYNYGWQWSVFLIGPMTFCALCNSHNDKPLASDKSAFLRGVAHFIVTPAVMVYTVILYAYTARVLVNWSLPHGGVAWLITAYFVGSMLGYMGNKWAPFNKFYDKFYRWFPYISIPLLVLFWWGVIYRIGAYSFTENRIYMVIAGTIITVAAVLLALRLRGSIKVMGWLTAASLALFTYIPGISAHSLGVTAQTNRLESLMRQLNVIDDAGHFKAYDKSIVTNNQDEIVQLQASYTYLLFETDAAKLKAKYRPLDNDEQNVLAIITKKASMDVTVAGSSIDSDDFAPFNTQGYPYYCGENYASSSKNNAMGWDINYRVVACLDGKKVLDEPINKVAINKLMDAEPANMRGTQLAQDAFTVRNDSVLIIINSFYKDDKGDLDYYAAYIYTTHPLPQKK